MTNTWKRETIQTKEEHKSLFETTKKKSKKFYYTKLNGKSKNDIKKTWVSTKEIMGKIKTEIIFWSEAL